MLVLSRKVGERILIGDQLVITVNRISNNRVALGISAPADVRIMRSEIEEETLPSPLSRQLCQAEPSLSCCAL